MPRRLIRRCLPDHRRIRDHRHLRLFGRLLHDPALWHLNRHSVARAFMVGLFCAFVPVPFQMVLAAALAILLHANLPVAVVMVWITNPLTITPMFYGAYVVGTWITGAPEQTVRFELSFDWLFGGLLQVWQPFLLGCFVTGLVLGTVGYGTIQLLWRWYVSRRWRRRGHAPR